VTDVKFHIEFLLGIDFLPLCTAGSGHATSAAAHDSGVEKIFGYGGENELGETVRGLGI
jgi:hypothetical protein